MVKEDVSVLEMDEFVELSERVADDPDAQPPRRYFELQAKYAKAGAAVGFRHGGPVMLSVGTSFLAATAGAQIGLDHAG